MGLGMTGGGAIKHRTGFFNRLVVIARRTQSFEMDARCRLG
jgi:hypothetical protein